jgi:hypothetical protein
VIGVALPFPPDVEGGAASSPGACGRAGAPGWEQAEDYQPWPGWADEDYFDGLSDDGLDDLASDDLMYADDLAGMAPGAEFGPGGLAETMPPGVPLHMLVEGPLPT